MVIMKKFLLILVGLWALLAPQTASAQSDAPISEKDSLRIVKIATQTSRLHHEAATEVGFKMDHCHAITPACCSSASTTSTTSRKSPSSTITAAFT